MLKVGELQYFWRVGHRHIDGCEEILRLRQSGSAAGLTLSFRPDATRHVPDGGVSSSGGIWTGDRHLNLHEPGVVRAFLDAAVRRGWLSQARWEGSRDGWDLFDEVYASRTATAR